MKLVDQLPVGAVLWASKKTYKTNGKVSRQVITWKGDLKKEGQTRCRIATHETFEAKRQGYLMLQLIGVPIDPQNEFPIHFCDTSTMYGDVPLHPMVRDFLNPSDNENAQIRLRDLRDLEVPL